MWGLGPSWFQFRPRPAFPRMLFEAGVTGSQPNAIACYSSSAARSCAPLHSHGYCSRRFKAASAPAAALALRAAMAAPAGMAKVVAWKGLARVLALAAHLF